MGSNNNITWKSPSIVNNHNKSMIMLREDYSGLSLFNLVDGGRLLKIILGEPLKLGMFIYSVIR